jgi:predicted ATPase/class 3 adenylate cyclase
LAVITEQCEAGSHQQSGDAAPGRRDGERVAVTDRGFVVLCAVMACERLGGAVVGCAASGAGAACENVAVPTSTEHWYPRSFVLTDVVSSVSLWERDAELMAQAVARHDAIIGREVAAASGQLVRSKGEGDSTFSVFAHPADAVMAAVAIQGAIGAEEWPTALPLRVRAGVHTGDAEPRDGGWFGPAVNRAARLRGLADGKQTLVSGVTAGLVADQIPASVHLLYRGRRVLRGIERPEEVWELVAADDPRLAVGAPEAVGGLPVALTRFVGQAADVERLVGLVEDQRLVTLTGPGGSGKTRLAMEVARDAQRHGEVVWLAELAPLRDGGRVGEAVAAAVGVQHGADLLQELLAHLEAMAGLLVLDNCEHLLGASGAVTGQLLAAAPGVRVLATSREPLGLPGERVWPVRPLAVPAASSRDHAELAGVESVQLLLDRARAVRPDLEIGDDDVASVVQICQVLDGVPLAIELAAGRLRSLSFADLAGRLADQLAVLTRSPSAAGDEVRHRTLRMTLDWSYDLLTDRQQTLARRLSVFAGGFRLDAVEAVGGGDIDVLDGVDELVAKSLVTFHGVTARYRLLEPLRQHLAQRLEESGEAELSRQAQAEWAAALCERLGGGTDLLEDKARTRRLREESGNIDVALRWALDHGDHEIALRIVGSLGHYWLRNDQASGRRWCAQVVQIAKGAAPRRRAKALVGAGIVAQSDAAWDRSIAWLSEALAFYRAEQLVAGQAISLFWLGRAFASRLNPKHLQDDSAEATRCFEEGLRLSMQLGNLLGASSFRNLLSSQAFRDGDLARAEQLSRQVIDECRSAGVRHPMGQALCNLAFIAYRRDRHDAAVELLRDAVALYRDVDDPWQLAATLVELAAQAASAGQGAVALHALAESTKLDEQIGRLPGRAYALAVAAVVHLARGETTLSIGALGAYDAHSIRETRRPWGELVRSIVWLGEVVETTRARLDPAAVAVATATARTRQIDELIDELITQPAKAERDRAGRRG